jgi:peptidoglycan/LPS O-acetylase OafA/YrhL
LYEREKIETVATGPILRLAIIVHKNNFGFLRLLFANLVILSHSFELVDGNRSRELLTRVFGTISFGELGVFGFFLISGYLITKSFQSSHSGVEYILKRILRIYPGYTVAYFLCLLLAPFVGGNISSLTLKQLTIWIIELRSPQMDGSFSGLPYSGLNGSMWTIAYEFRCYLLVLALWPLGLLDRKLLLLFLVAAALAISSVDVGLFRWFPDKLVAIFGDPFWSLRLTAVFGCGALFHLYRDRITFTNVAACLCGASLLIALFFRPIAVPAVAILGGYVLFWFAFNVRSSQLSAIGQRIDISYGTYLYAWPLQNLLVWLYPAIPPWLVFAAATIGAGMLGLFSWLFVERPFLQLKSSNKLLRPSSCRHSNPRGKPTPAPTLSTQSTSELSAGTASCRPQPPEVI